MKKIAIVTVNFNGKVDTLEFLDSIKKLDTSGFELLKVVVDNGSTDGSVYEILKQFPEVELLQTGENLGFSGGFNRGMRFAKSYGVDYTLIINNDTFFEEKNLLQKLTKTLESDASIGLVSPKILFAPGFEFQREQKNSQEKVIWYAGGNFDWDNIMSKHRGIDEIDRGQYDHVEKADFVSGCCLLIKNEIFDKVGFLDESLFAYFEDNDFVQRVENAGFKKFYDGSAYIYHKVSQTSGIGSPITDYYLTRNRLIFGMRYASLRTKFALIRQGLGFLVWGRSMQKKGFLDFIKGKTGALLANQSNQGQVVFPKTVSIAFVNYNTAGLVKKLLESIFDTKSGFDRKSMEVLMLDDNSPTDPEPEIKKFMSRIRFFKNSQNLRFTRSYNRVIHLSKGKYVLVINSDIEILKNTISELIKTEEKFGGQAVLGGRLYFPDMRSQDSVYYLPTIWGAIKEYFFKIKGAYFMYVPKPEKLTRVEGIVGACMFIPRIVFNKAGFFNEQLNSYFEDIDICRRFKKLNIPVYFVPEAKFIHVHGASFKKLEGQAYEILKESSIKYHGKFCYLFLYLTLWLCQKLTSTKPDGSIK